MAAGGRLVQADGDAGQAPRSKLLRPIPIVSFVATFIGEGAPRFYLPLDQQLRNPNFAQLLVMAKDDRSARTA